MQRWVANYVIKQRSANYIPRKLFQLENVLAFQTEILFTFILANNIVLFQLGIYAYILVKIRILSITVHNLVILNWYFLYDIWSYILTSAAVAQYRLIKKILKNNEF